MLDRCKFIVIVNVPYGADILLHLFHDISSIWNKCDGGTSVP
jgi:hypothetical protein